MKSKGFITGIWHSHAFTTNIMKIIYAKGNPKVNVYRYYNKFDFDFFQVKLQKWLKTQDTLALKGYF